MPRHIAFWSDPDNNGDRKHLRIFPIVENKYHFCKMCISHKQNKEHNLNDIT